MTGAESCNRSLPSVGPSFPGAPLSQTLPDDPYGKVTNLTSDVEGSWQSFGS